MQAMWPNKVKTATVSVLLALSCGGVAGSIHLPSSGGRAEGVKEASPAAENPEHPLEWPSEASLIADFRGAKLGDSFPLSRGVMDTRT
jgi:hypothetical protein